MFRTRFARYFVEVAAHNSIRKASEKLNVAASAINRHILNAEETLGVQLFDRSPAGLRLTRAGDAILDHLSQSAGREAALERFLDDLRAPGGGEIRLAVADGLAASFVPDAVARIRLAYPRMRFVVTVANAPTAAAMLRAGRCDVALTFDPPSLAGLHVLCEIVTEVGVLVPRAHRLGRKETITLAECAGEPLIAPDPSTALRQMLDRLFADNSPALNIVFSSNNVGLLCDMVAHGLGIAILRDLDARGLNRGDATRFVPLRDLRAGAQRLSMVAAEDQRHPDAIAAVIAMLREDFLALGDAVPRPGC